MPVALRPYQRDTLCAIRDARATVMKDGAKLRRALVVLATGLGKTLLMAELPRTLHLKHGETLLILTHRDELIKQTVEKVQKQNPSFTIGIEQSFRKASEASDVVVASVPTLQDTRLDDFVRTFARKIAVIAIDEAHHAVAPSYQKIVSAFPGAFVVGVTATPRRGDQVGLGATFDRIVIHRDLEWGIEHGYLVPLKSYVAKSNVDLGEIKSRGDDFAKGELERAINTAARNALIVQTYLQHAAGKKALVFCASVDHAVNVTREFLRRGIGAACASASTHEFERVRIVDDFRSGALRVLVNCGLYIEGFDVPDVEVVVNARPTKSPALYAQITGRVLRPLDDIAGVLTATDDPRERQAIIRRSRKPMATIIDVLDGTPRPGLQSLPTLWGLPANFELAGQDVRLAVKKFMAVSARDPKAANAALSIDDFDVALHEIDAFAPPVPDAIVAESSQYNWLRIPGNAHRLSLPPAYVPVGTAPDELAGARRKTGYLVRKAQAAGEPDPVATVEAETGQRIATLEEWIEVTPTLLERWETKVYQTIFRKSQPPLERSRMLADENERIAAFQAADEWLKAHRHESLPTVNRHAAWRSQPMSDSQKTLLRRHFGVPKALLPQTKGEANDLIVRLKNERPRQMTGGPVGKTYRSPRVSNG